MTVTIGLVGQRVNRSSCKSNCMAMLAAMQLDLHEERLTLCPTRPIVTVIDPRVPLEVVVCLTQIRSLGRPASDGGVVTRALEDCGNGLNSGRQMDFFHTAPAAMILCADRCLIHARD